MLTVILLAQGAHFPSKHLKSWIFASLQTLLIEIGKNLHATIYISSFAKSYKCPICYFYISATAIRFLVRVTQIRQNDINILNNIWSRQKTKKPFAPQPRYIHLLQPYTIRSPDIELCEAIKFFVKPRQLSRKSRDIVGSCMSPTLATRSDFWRSGIAETTWVFIELCMRPESGDRSKKLREIKLNITSVLCWSYWPSFLLVVWENPKNGWCVQRKCLLQWLFCHCILYNLAPTTTCLATTTETKTEPPHSTCHSPYHSCRNDWILPESTGIHQNETGIRQNANQFHRNATGIHWNELPYLGAPLT